MTQSFSELKRSASNSFDKLNQELTKLNTNQSNTKDDRLWTCQTDKVGNGYAVIRFLPAPVGEDVPFVRMFTHGFKGSGGWYIEKSLTTLGQQDPASEHNKALWNSGIESDKKIVSGSGKDNPGSKRQLNFYSNIYVVNDPSNPENEGKVFLFRYGKKIFDKLSEVMAPEFKDEKPMDPFNLWSGANFILKIRQVEGYPNYEKCKFDDPSPLLDDDDRLEEIWKSQYSLKEIIDPKHFLSYDELKRRLDRALGVSGAKASTNLNALMDDDIPSFEESPPLKSAAAKPAPSASEDDDDFEFFKKLSEED